MTPATTLDDNLALRQHTMAAVVCNPGLCDLLCLIGCQTDDARVARLAREAQDLCMSYLHTTRKKAATTRIPAGILRTADALYGLMDNALTAASIRERIVMWHTACTMAIHQANRTAPYSLTTSDCIASHASDYVTMSTADICAELLDASDLIEAYLDDYFPDEYDDNDAEDKGFDAVVQLMIRLKFLAGVLENDGAETG